jgi:hypothetical protein
MPGKDIRLGTAPLSAKKRMLHTSYGGQAWITGLASGHNKVYQIATHA